MTPQPTPTEAPAQPGNVTPIFNPADGPAPATPYPGDGPSIDEAKAMAGPEPYIFTDADGPDQPGGAADASTLGPPSQEEIDAARKGLEDDMREAVPFNRLAIHTSFQRAIQEMVSSSKPEKVGMLCTAFRNFAEAEALLATKP